jgi:hypothetical protein
VLADGSGDLAVPNPEQRSETGVDRDVRASEPADYPLHGKDTLVVEIDQLLNLEPDLVEGFRNVLPPAPKALVSVVGAGDRGLSDVVELKLGVGQLQRQVPAGEAICPSTNKLDVLLRHRPRSISLRRRRVVPGNLTGSGL